MCRVKKKCKFALSFLFNNSPDPSVFPDAVVVVLVVPVAVLVLAHQGPLLQVVCPARREMTPNSYVVASLTLVPVATHRYRCLIDPQAPPCCAMILRRVDILSRARSLYRRFARVMAEGADLDC